MAGTRPRANRTPAPGQPAASTDSRAAVTTLTGINTDPRNRVGTSWPSQREIPDGSVDRMISSHGMAAERVLGGLDRIARADLTRRLGTQPAEAVHERVEATTCLGRGLRLRPR